MKVFFKGCSGIKSPTDLNGVEIKAGDKLSWDYGDSTDIIKSWMKAPIFRVRTHKNGKGFYASGLHQELYLHDFRFKYCEILNA